MTGKREKEREFEMEPSKHHNGGWRLEIGSHRFGKPSVAFLLNDNEARALRALLNFNLEDS